MEYAVFEQLQAERFDDWQAAVAYRDEAPARRQLYQRPNDQSVWELVRPSAYGHYTDDARTTGDPR